MAGLETCEQGEVVRSMAASRKFQKIGALAAGAISLLFLSCYSPVVEQTLVSPTISELEAGDGEVIVQWIPPPGMEVNHYYIYYGTGTLSRSFEYVSTPDGSSRAQAITGLTNDVEYHFAVLAITDSGESPLSESKTATPNEPSPEDRGPGKPENVQIALGVSKVYVFWEAPSDIGIINGDGTPGTITGYKIYASQTTPIDPNAITPQLADETSLSLELIGLNDGSPYYIAVAAVNETGDGDLSAAVSAIPTAAPPDREPSSPRITQISSQDGQVMVEWTAPIDTGIVNGAEGKISDYKLYFSEAVIDPQKDTPKDLPVTGGPLMTTITQLTNGTTYNFAMTAITGSGESPLSEGMSATPSEASSANRKPGQPMILAVTEGFEELLVTWQAPADTGTTNDDGTVGIITGYKIYVTILLEPLDLNSPTMTVSSNSEAVQVQKFENLENGTSYSLIVVAVSDAGDGTPSAVAIGTPSEEKSSDRVPSQPSIITLTEANGKVTLEWAAPTDPGIVSGSMGEITGYQVKVSPLNPAAAPSKVADIGGESVKMTISGLAAGIPYSIVVRAKNAHGWGEFSNPEEFTL